MVGEPFIPARLLPVAKRIMKMHIYKSRKIDGTWHDSTLCGADGKSMSWHEVKRGRITCPECLVRFIKEKNTTKA